MDEFASKKGHCYTAIIVGSGLSGLGMAVRLKQAGYDDFIILEKANDLGGTWRDNTYPGAACDIPSALYSYSFDQNLEWKEAYTKQADLLEYQRCIATNYDILPALRYNQHVTSARFDDTSKTWTIDTNASEEGTTTYVCQHFISAVGQLHHPKIPEAFKNRFDSDSFHSAQWDHSISLEGKRVAVIGTGASSIQIVPEVAKIASHVEVYQRTPPYVLPKIVGSYSNWQLRFIKCFPILNTIYRGILFMLMEYLVLPAIRGQWFCKWLVQFLAAVNRRRSISDPALRAALTPTDAPGGKRCLFSNHYYAALAQSNVNVNSSGIEEVDVYGVKDKEDNHVDFDVIIFATGFITNPFLLDIQVTGRNSKSLHDAWSEKGAHAFMGVSKHGFPNLHMLYGPNTNLGHTSILQMTEAQMEFIVRAIQMVDKRGCSSLEVTKSAEDDFVEEIDRRMEETAFSKVENSWYRQQGTGRITNNWVGGVKEYQRRLKKTNWNLFEFGDSSSMLDASKRSSSTEDTTDDSSNDFLSENSSSDEEQPLDDSDHEVIVIDIEATESELEYDA